MTDTEKAIKHFESLQKRYTTQHKGEQCKFVKCAIEAICEKQEREKWHGVEHGLLTTWETPIQCHNCMEHLSLDWSFCPECGTPIENNEREE